MTVKPGASSTGSPGVMTSKMNIPRDKKYRHGSLEDRNAATAAVQYSTRPWA